MLVKLTPDGSDEDEAKCKVCPRDFGFPDKKLKIATFTCQHRYTRNWICAAPCDGYDDLCLNFEDENCNPSSIFFLTLIVCFFLLFIAIVGEIFIHFQGCLNNKIEDIEIEDNMPNFAAPLHVLMQDLFKENGKKIRKKQRKHFSQVTKFYSLQCFYIKK